MKTFTERQADPDPYGYGYSHGMAAVYDAPEDADKDQPPCTIETMAARLRAIYRPIQLANILGLDVDQLYHTKEYDEALRKYTEGFCEGWRAEAQAIQQP